MAGRGHRSRRGDGLGELRRGRGLGAARGGRRRARPRRLRRQHRPARRRPVVLGRPGVLRRGRDRPPRRARRRRAAAPAAWSRPACAPRPRSPAHRRAAWTRRWRCSPSPARRCSSTSSTTRPAVPLPLADAGLAILVVDTRVSHALVDGGYASRRADCETACRELGVPSLREATLDRRRSADRRPHPAARPPRRHRDRPGRPGGRRRSSARDWPGVGELFVASHASMRDDFEISCPELDVAVEAARRAARSAPG